jgi:hypothetical protein
MRGNRPNTGNDPTIMGNERPRRDRARDDAGTHSQREHSRRPNDDRPRTTEEFGSDIKRSGPQPGGQKSTEDV